MDRIAKKHDCLLIQQLLGDAKCLTQVAWQLMLGVDQLLGLVDIHYV